ncbi:MAG: extracellular solute-binding protein [Chloroflexi bacterium]|nr:extracellular solute-binding protein [Chloroflexota bacterium]
MKDAHAAGTHGRTRRGVLGSALAAAPLVVAAACGPAGQSGQEGAAKGQGTSASSGAPITLDMAWEQVTNEMGIFVNGQAREIFEQRHPNIKLNFIDQGNGREKVTTQLAAGTPPHVLHLGVNLPAFYVAQNALLAIDSLAQKDKEASKANFAPNMWETFTAKGKQYALPREAGPTVLYYNKSLVQGGGVQAPTDQWTLANEYKDAAVKLTKQGEPGVFGTELGNWRNWVYSSGGDILDATFTKYTLDQAAAVDALQLYQDFRYRFKCTTTPQDNSAQGALQRFMAGGLALSPGLRSAGNNKGFVQPHVGIALHPRGKAGRKFNMPGNGLAIVQPNNKAIEQSWEAIKWYVSAEFQKLHYKTGIGGVAARLETLKSEEYLSSAIPREWNEFFAKGVPDLKVPPKLSNWPEIDDTINKALGDFQNGKETAAATKRIVPVVEALLKVAVR